ncbi:MAG TPA: glycosyltransferase family 87 protein [Tepidisphaeraceae bacterium]|jgi:hypothetical protein
MSISRQTRLAVWIALVLAVVVGQAVWLIALRGERILNSDGLLIGGQILLVSLLLGLMALLATTPVDALRLSEAMSTRLIVLMTVLFQGAAVVLLWPGISEDLARYRLDGGMWLAGVSPYAVTPAEFSARGGRMDGIDATVTFPNLHTIYPPLAEGIFAAGRVIERICFGELPAQRVDPPPTMRDREVRFSGVKPWREQIGAISWQERGVALRGMAGCFAVVATCLLLAILRQRGSSPWWAVLFAWNPLLTMECAGMGHIDIAGVCLLLGALWLADRQRFAGSGALVALAGAVKPIGLALMPFAVLAAYRARGLRAAGGTLAVGAAVLIIMYLPALYQHGYAGWRQTAEVYSRHWEANGSVAEVIKIVFGQGNDGWAMVHAKEYARITSAVVVLVAMLLLLWSGASLERAGYWIPLVALLTAPVVYPWYLLWILCMVPLLRGRAGWAGLLWSGTVAMAYLLWHQPTWRLRAGQTVAEYAIVFGVVVAELVFAHESAESEMR